MDFAFSSEQDALREAVRGMVASRLTPGQVNALADSPGGVDADLTSTLAAMGLFDDDLTFLDQAVVLEETGAALLSSTWFVTSALARPLVEGDELAKRVADPSSCRLTVAWAEPGLRSVSRVPETTSRVGPDGRVSGHKVDVLDLAAATHALVVARRPDSSLVAVEVDLADPGVTRLSRSTLDASRRVGELVLDGARSRPVAPVPARGWPERYLSAIACEAIGVARAALDMGVEHATVREQFGRQIGSYQGVSHRLAHVRKQLELARSLTYRAAWTVDEDLAHATPHRELVRAAVLSATDAAVSSTEATIQVLGGVGMTWEHPIHRWYKRALHLRALAGPRAEAQQTIASAVVTGRVSE